MSEEEFLKEWYEALLQNKEASDDFFDQLEEIYDKAHSENATEKDIAIFGAVRDGIGEAIQTYFNLNE